MARFNRNGEPGQIEHVAGNGLLHRRALLKQDAVLAGALSAGAGFAFSGAAAEPLGEQGWSLAPGDPVPDYQTPSKFAKKVVRSLSNPDFEPRTSQSRTPVCAENLFRVVDEVTEPVKLVNGVGIDRISGGFSGG